MKKEDLPRSDVRAARVFCANCACSCDRSQRPQKFQGGVPTVWFVREREREREGERKRERESDVNR